MGKIKLVFLFVCRNDSQTNSEKKDPNIEEEESSNDDLKPKKRGKKSGTRKAAAVKEEQDEDDDHGMYNVTEFYQFGLHLTVPHCAL